jgi:hypothetical protein
MKKEKKHYRDALTTDKFDGLHNQEHAEKVMARVDFAISQIQVTRGDELIDLCKWQS